MESPERLSSIPALDNSRLWKRIQETMSVSVIIAYTLQFAYLGPGATTIPYPNANTTNTTTINTTKSHGSGSNIFHISVPSSTAKVYALFFLIEKRFHTCLSIASAITIIKAQIIVSGTLPQNSSHIKSVAPTILRTLHCRKKATGHTMKIVRIEAMSFIG